MRHAFRAVRPALVILVLLLAACSAPAPAAPAPAPTSGDAASRVPAPAAAPAAAPTVGPPQQITIATPSTGFHEFPAITAMRQGFYKDENLEVTRIQMAPPTTAAALLSGDVGYSIAIGSVISAIVGSDAPLKVLMGFATRSLHVLMTSDPNVRTMADLRGRSVAVSTLTDTTANLVRLAVRQHGLEPQVDVTLQALGESPNRLAAMQSGQVSGVLLDLAYAVEAERQGARILLRPADLAALPLSGMTTTEAKLRQDPQQVEAVLRATLRGTRYMREHREDTVALMMEHMGITRDVAERTYDLGVESFAVDGLIQDNGLQLLIDAAKETSGRPSTVTPADVADFTLARRAGAVAGSRP
jgi:ABC-type nitrate/sulfonate/bicarbonate transport system substrate-binding protein